jgi:NTP pyrophosphatase (non-canonical NTP hydrolase)
MGGLVEDNRMEKKGGNRATKRAATKKMDDGVTIGELKEMMRVFVGEREWGKFHTPRNLAASVAVEAGELLELFQWLTAEEAERRSREDAGFRRAVGEEMSDVVMYVLSLANAMELDLAAAIERKMAKNRVKYPAEQVRGKYERPLGS